MNFERLRVGGRMPANTAALATPESATLAEVKACL